LNGLISDEQHEPLVHFIIFSGSLQTELPFTVNIFKPVQPPTWLSNLWYRFTATGVAKFDPKQCIKTATPIIELCFSNQTSSYNPITLKKYSSNTYMQNQHFRHNDFVQQA
jgi:hypothetical protein